MFCGTCTFTEVDVHFSERAGYGGGGVGREDRESRVREGE